MKWGSRLVGLLLVLVVVLLPLVLMGCQGGSSNSRPEGVGPNDTIVDNPRGNGIKKKGAPGGD